MGVAGLALLPTGFPALNDRAEGFDVPDERPCKVPRLASGQRVPYAGKQVLCAPQAWTVGSGLYLGGHRGAWESRPEMLLSLEEALAHCDGKKEV